MARTEAQIRHHYEIEKAIADRLKSANREERKAIYAVMYDELFKEVPDHPRLTRRDDPVAVARYTRSKMRLLQPFFSKDKILAEFASGDGNLAVAASEKFGQVYAIDISDQRKSGMATPRNMKMILYNGYDLPLPDGSVDVVFSDMLIEHLHPEDTRMHFETAMRILKPGGVYVFRTPHAMSGPWDMSRRFAKVAECFHLKEWTYAEMVEMLKSLGLKRWESYWVAKGVRLRLPTGMFVALEKSIQFLPHGIKRRLARLIAPVLCMYVYKPIDDN
jgi:ubiquinone/menaquinone biosynthesis C-methylase UbiE